MGRRKKLKKELICEDWCFICKDGGSLRICDYKDCLKAYHPECVGKNDSMLENEDIWACNWHYCFLCNKVSKFYCFCCPFSVCGRCLHNAEFTLVRRNKGFCNDCLELTLLIEENRDVDSNGHKIDFNDQDTLEFLFKEYWLVTKKKEGFTSEEIISTYNVLKSGKKCSHDSDSFEYNEGEEDISEFEDGKQLIMSDYDEYFNDSEERKQVGRRKRSKRKLSVVKRDLNSKKKEFIGWGSKPLMEFLTSIGKDTNRELSEYDIATIIIEYCKENKLFHPERNKKIICDSRLQPLFRRKSLNKNSIHNLLTAHLAENMDHSEDELGCYSPTLNEDVLVAGKKQQHAISSVKRHDQSKKEVVEVKKSCFASVVPKNIKLVYLKRSLVEELSKQLENFDDKIIGSLVRVKADPNDYLQKNSYQLVQVTGIKKPSIMNSEILLQVSNMVKEVLITKLSDDDFSEEECEDLHQRVKNGLLKRPTVVELDQKARSLHEDITKHWIGREIVSLQNRVNRANEKGWRRELSEYLDNLLLLQSPAEQSRLLNEVPEVIAETIDEEPEPAYEDSTRKEGQECKDGSSDSAPSRTSKTSSGNLEGNGISYHLTDNPGQQEMITAVAAVITGKSVQVEEPVLTTEMNNVDHLSCMNCYEATMSPSSHDASQEPSTPSSPQVQAHTPPPDPPQSFTLAIASESTSPNPVNSMPLENQEIMVTRASAEQCASTSAPSHETSGPPFSNLGEAQAFFAEVDHMLDESMKDFPESLPMPVAPQDINQAKCVLYQYRFLNFESLMDPDQRDQFNSSLELLLKANYFPSSVLNMVRRFHMNFVSNINLYLKSQETVETVDKNIEDTMALRGCLENNRGRFDQVMRDIKLRTDEIDELTKHLEEKLKLRADLEAEANDLAELSKTSKEALARSVHTYKTLEKNRKEAEEAIEQIEAFWEHFRIQTSKFL
ncbi:hypothetical protein Dsin_030781 [Dipteronia sinensis]|uniref:Zinc finger PHD-type domain-containing protein n=1 Tax=Dipteronia sinensis TaxID=43782 RepID=A0AAD9ZL85_9ROSI|nr:hypothetical protein Dsin_030781 [Dipteronia sinensis]